jgi:hypothetical protein
MTARKAKAIATAKATATANTTATTKATATTGVLHSVQDDGSGGLEEWWVRGVVG